MNAGVGPARRDCLAVAVASLGVRWLGGAGAAIAAPGAFAQGAAAPQIVVNGTPLAAAQVAALEQRYRVRIRPGAYWYDRATGAWGVQGGPVAGVIAAGLALGGPLRSNASNGTSGIFINGRQLHALDVARLMTFMRPLPGRYWMDAAGNFGYERGPAIGNVYALANRSRSPRQGILSTYDKTGAVVIGP